ncbi:class I SAM-dependent methyltransferase [Acuticoccus mangrovi]|uniref:Methyltransferase domain-containing protein n=1 Tax=Acuticoccus mangrovi TaxID=2796142 RepID=A0A934IQ66_9HYPH|nr:class I SAM-dependent methyltransferase [Acuticoccus mangrovi]MBJ3775584.1 methyltransferase domain-containing protein [Acuticoccus mangrovi]
MATHHALDTRAEIDFVLAMRRRWADRLYPALKEEYDAVTGDAPPAERSAAGETTETLPLYPWFAWMERGSQKMLWRAVERAVADEPAIELPAAPKGSLELHPEIDMPTWYTDWDIHVQPGGVWQSDMSARTYELGAKLVMLGGNDDYLFHRRFVETCLAPLEGKSPTRLVDVGCGFGKSTWPLKKTFPEAEVIGIDLAAPCLRLAHAKAEEQGLAIRFIQGDCQATGLEAGSADLVTSTMLLHEVPRPALEATIAEAARILKPGGLLRMLDFQYTGDAFRDFQVSQHGARNNEPFMPGAMSADTLAMCEAAGLVNARWVAFDERGGGRLESLAWPTRSEWHFPWAVLEAEKPA